MHKTIILYASHQERLMRTTLDLPRDLLTEAMKPTHKTVHTLTNAHNMDRSTLCLWDEFDNVERRE